LSTVTGAMLTSNILSDQLALDFGDEIALLDPTENPFTLLTRMASKKRTVSYTYSHFEDRRKARFDTISGINNTTTQSIAVANGAYYQQWDLWQVTRTGEIMRIDGVSGNTLTVTRNIAPSGVGTGVATVASDEFMLIGTAQPENDTSKPARSDVPTKITNYTQILRTPFELSDRLRASMFQLSPSEWNRQQKMKGIEHAIDIESAFLFGKKSDTTPGAAHDTTTAGILASITTNQTDAGGDLSEAEWNAFMATCFVGGGGADTKLLLASSTVVSALNKFPASKQQTTNNEKTYGMNVTEYQSPFGNVKIAGNFHKLLKGTKYGGYGVVVDMNNVSYRYLANDEMSRDTKLLTQRQARDQDGRKDEFLSDVGLQVRLQETHGVLTGVTS
jgi:hypothetical protein